MAVTGVRQIGLPALDLERAVEFYRDVLGLPVLARFGNLAFFDLAGVRLLLEAADDAGPPSGVLYLHVDDIGAEHAALVSVGLVFQSDPHPIFVDEHGTFGPEGETELMAFFLDSEGNQLALASRERR